MSRRTTLAVLALLASAGAAAAGPLNPPAGPVTSSFKTLNEVEPRIAISLANTPGDADSVFKITQPGSYMLTENLSAPAGKHGIEIATTNVTIDLNGFRIMGPASGLTCGIISGSGQLLGGMTGITIRNGQITGFLDAGIRLGVTTQSDRAKGGSIENVVARLNNLGVVSGDGFTLTNVVAEANANTGILVYDGCTLSRCIARSNSQHGISSNGGVVISDCSATSNGGSGMAVGVRAAISNCVAESNNADGFSVGSSGVVTGCVATDNGDDGFTVTGATIQNCTAQFNTGDGFQLSSGTSLTGSVARINTGVGVRVTSGDNRIDSNHLVSNTAGGLDLNNVRNFVIRNTAAGHGANSFLNTTSNYFGDQATGAYVNMTFN